MSSIASLEAEVKRLRKKAKTLEKRIKQLKNVKSGMQSKLSDCINDANNAIRACAQNLMEGIIVPGWESTAPDDVLGKRQKAVEEDAYINQVIVNIDSEISRCETEMKELIVKINELEERMRVLKEKEAVSGAEDGGEKS